MNSILEEFKHAWNRPNNGLMQLIIINIIVFVVLEILSVFSRIFGFELLFESIFKQFIIPAPIRRIHLETVDHYHIFLRP